VRRIVGVLVLAAAAATGCSEQGPVAGELSVRLAISLGTDRAVLFQVVGKQHGVTVGTGASYRILSDTSATGDTAWVAVIAPQGATLAAGEIARITVPDTRNAGSYQISLTEAVAPDYSVGVFPGIRLTIVKP
jgi:hypothetical protein